MDGLRQPYFRASDPDAKPMRGNVPNLLRTALLYARTLRNLRPRQVGYLALRRAQRALRRSAPGVYAVRYKWSSRIHRSTDGQRPPACTRAAFDVAHTLAEVDPESLGCLKEGEIQALGRTARIKELEWEAELHPPLWGYRVHYFDEALPLALAAARGDTAAYRTLREWILDWIRRCRPLRGPGWDPYPVSQRLRNWVWVDLLLAPRVADIEFLAALRTSAAVQASFLADHVERDLLANHLVKNATALFLAGVAWPFLRPAARWRKVGEKVLRTESREQILPDGGHFERSPTYHGAVLLDFLELNLLARAAGIREPVPADVLRRMAEFHRDLTYPDGARARFNDSAEGLVPAAGRLQQLYDRTCPQTAPTLAAGPIRYPDTGYYGYRDPARGEVFVIDAGPPGPRYQPGHAHCDLLSFELYLDGRPFIVDPGVCGYAGDPFRHYARSTRAHNTLCVDAREQSEIWGNFRVARMARVLSAEMRTQSRASWRFVGSYVPYYDSRLRHERRVHRYDDGTWEIADKIEGGHIAAITGALTFHPDVNVSVDGRRILCTAKRLAVVVETEGVETLQTTRGSSQPVDGWFFPAFGVAIPATTVRYRLAGRTGRLILRRVRSG